MSKSRLVVFCVAVVAALAAAAPVLADDFSNGSGANAAANWKVYGINSSGMAYDSSAVTALGPGTARRRVASQ